MSLGCQALAARQWLSRRPEASSALSGPPVVEVRSAGEGRGLGLYAIRHVKAFSKIFSDAPLILMQPSDDLPELYQQFSNLPAHAKEKYLSLSNQPNPARDAMLKDKLLQRGFGSDALQEMATVASIMQTNAFNVDLQDGRGPTHRALFPQIARVNHSCAPNAHVCFYPPDHNSGSPQNTSDSSSSSKGRMTIHTLRALQPGEEILIAYFNILLPHADRHAKAQKWSFTCLCPVCDTSSSQHSVLESQRTALRAFTAQQAKLTHPSRAPMKSLAALFAQGEELCTSTLGRPELFPTLPDLYDGMAMLRAKMLVAQRREEERRGDLVELLGQAAMWEARITGPDSPATRRRLEKMCQFAAKRGQMYQPYIIVTQDDQYQIEWPA